MTVIRWTVAGIVFLVLLLFSLQNADLVTVRFFDVGAMEAPLIFLLLLAFAAGVALGLLASAVRIVRLTREVARLRRAAPAPLPPAPAPHGAAPAAPVAGPGFERLG
jgi:lipopolysaccharide assembly protein A